MKKRVLIIGAGPAGLAAAYRLHNKGNRFFSVDVVEADNQVGGLSKTVEFNGYCYDLGGHRFFSKIGEVVQLWNDVLKDDLLTRNRLSRIYYNYKFYNYPLQIKNAFMNLGLYESFLIGLSYLKAKLFPRRPEITFDDWVINRFGERLYRTFFKTYTEKVWGIPCSQIQSEWAAQRIKDLSMITALRHALSWRKKSNKVKTLMLKFQYPKYGPGMMYEAMASLISKNKDFQIHLRSEVVKLSHEGNAWSATIRKRDGGKSVKQYDDVVSTMPITSLISNMDYKMPNKIRDIARHLQYRDFLIVCLVFDKANKLGDNWIYLHDSRIKAGRLQVFNSWSPYMLKDKNSSSYGVEYFCNENDDIWSKSDDELVKLAVDELKTEKLVSSNYNCVQGNVVRVKKAYPVYNMFYADNMAFLTNFLKGVPNLQVAGRCGMFKYNNMDHSIYTGLLAADNILSGTNKYDIWSVNQDEEYHEAMKSKQREETVVEVFEVDPPQ